jgi:hypothetical protein
MNRCVVVFTICLLTVFLAREPLVSFSSSEMKPIQGIHIVTNFPETTYAGSEIEAHYRFRNIAKKEVPVAVHFIITGPAIEMGKWAVTITIDEDEVECHEVKAGFFESNEYLVAPKSWHDLRIKVSLPPDMPPSTYTLTMELYSTEVKVPQK